MKFVICGSMKFSKEMVKLKERLNSLESQALQPIILNDDLEKIVKKY